MLKKCLLWIISILWLWLSFSSANFVNYWQYIIDYSVNQYPFWLDDTVINFQQDWLLCVDYFLDDPVSNSMWLTISQSNWSNNVDEIISNGMWIYCAQLSSNWSKYWTVWIELREEVNWYAWLYFFPSWWGWWSCPEVDTWAILSGSCDINYCVENWLCPTWSWSRSELVINDIVHEWKPLININIPDYIQWDYTWNENQYDIYVWSWYDQDYIDSILKINSYRPDSKDFTQTFVSWLTLIFPYIFVALLIAFIWKLLKRIFK